MAIKLSALFTCIVARFDREESKGCAGAIKDVAHVVGDKVVRLPQKGRSPNVSAAFREVMQKSWAMPQRFAKHRYMSLVHGAGLCGEYPYIPYPQDLIIRE